MRNLAIAACCAISIVTAAAPAKSESKISEPTSGVPTLLFGFAGSSAPEIALAVSPGVSKIVCRQRTRSKMFELGATRMASEEADWQYGTIGSVKVGVWCRGDGAYISAASASSSAAFEMRDEFFKLF